MLTRCVLAVLLTATSTIALSAQMDPSAYVDPFTGAFTYGMPVVTIPGPGGSGYTVSLQYDSNVRPEQEASWVGYGWSLSLPQISREKRGIPDDHRNSEIIARHKVPKRTVDVFTPWGSLELFKNDKNSTFSGQAGISLSIISDSESGLDVRVGSSLRAQYSAFSGSLGIAEGVGLFGSVSVHAGVHADSSMGGASIGLSFSRSTRLPLFSSSMATVSMSSTNSQITVKIGSNEVPGGEVGVSHYRSTMSVSDATLRGYGFLWAPQEVASTTDRVLLDYSNERMSISEDEERPFSTIPIAEPDMFHVRAPGVSGTFRAYHRLPFEVFPPRSLTASTNTNLHAEIMLSPNISAGVGTAIPPTTSGEFYVGPHEIGGMGSRSLAKDDLGVTSLRPFVFRFIADPADELRQSNSDAPTLGALDGGLPFANFHELNRDRPVGMSRSIRPVFWSEVAPLEKFFRLKTVDPVMLHGLGDHSLLGFDVVSNDGGTIQFREPVIVAKEEQLTRVLRGQPSFSRAAPRVYHVPISDAGKDPEERYAEYHGVTSQGAYAEAFLATLITSPDYADKGAVGPTNDDDGAWTKFSYRLISGRYDIRAPYNGYYFDKGALENDKDDRLYVNRMKRQIKVIQTIETATHIATFFTNVDDGLGERKDAWQAQEEQVAQTDLTGKSGSNHSVYLTRIELRKKGLSGQTSLVQTTHFAYDYSLVPGNPSSSPGFGKLTLRKVWTEDHGVKDAFIAPAEFHYEYPNLSANGGPGPQHIAVGRLATTHCRFPLLQSTMPSTVQNPAFDYNDIDAWGYRGAVGAPAAVPNFRPGDPVLPLRYDQRPTAASDADYAAPYALKRVHLPTGAELVVRYEPSDYSFVQDSSTMDDFPLIGVTPTTTNPDGWNQHQFDVDVSRVPLQDRPILMSELRRRFIVNRERLQAAFTYQMGLRGCCLGEMQSALADFKTYLLVQSVVQTPGNPNGIRITIGDPVAPVGGAAEIREMKDRARKLPFAIALARFRDAQRSYYRPEMTGNVIVDAGTLIDLLVDFDDPADINEGDEVHSTQIPTLIPNASSVRFPLVGSKYASVPRVRAIALISPNGSLQSDDASLVGRAYTYHDFIGESLRSSGVATAEPGALRNSMGLVQYLHESSDGARQGMAASMSEIARFEVPVGEYYLPRASIGYSKITETSLYGGTTNSGAVVRRFLTVKDIPTLRVEATKRNAVSDPPIDLLDVLFDISEESLEVQQGYGIHIREGHGYPLSVERYAGTISCDEPQAIASGVNDGLALTSASRWYYENAGQPVLVFDSLDRPLRYRRLGTEMEITSESRAFRTSYENFQVQVGVSFSGVPPYFSVGVAPSFRSLVRTCTTYVSNKVIRHPLHLRAIVQQQDGVIDSTEIVAYDGHTGAVAVSRRFDGFHGTVRYGAGERHNGSMVTVNVPAVHSYAGMRSKAEAEQVVLASVNTSPAAGMPRLADGGPWTSAVNLTASALSLTIVPNWPRIAERSAAVEMIRPFLTQGDEIEVTSANGERSRGVVSSIVVTSVGGAATGITLTVQNWSGSAPSDPRILKIVRSGRTNQLGQLESSYNLYGVDVDALKSYALLLRDRQQWTEEFTDWARAGWGNVGMRWARPVARFYATAPNGSNLENPQDFDPTLYSTIGQPPVVTWCDQSHSQYEFVIKSAGGSQLPTGAARSLNVGYHERQATAPFFICTLSPLASYQSTLQDWTRWRRFYVNDAADLVHGIATAPKSATRITPDLMFGFRDEMLVNGTLSWDVSQLYRQPMVMKASQDAMTVIAAAGTQMTRVPLGTSSSQLGTYRPEATFAVATDQLHDGVAGSNQSTVYTKMGSYTLGSAWNPLASTVPSPWRKVGRVSSWNKYGMPTESEDMTGLPTVVKYTSDGRLPIAVVTGATDQTVFVDPCEENPANTSNVRNHTGQGRSMPYVVSPNLATITDQRIPLAEYTLQIWIDMYCPLDQVTVTIDGVSYSGAALESRLIGVSSPMGLFEFTGITACSTLSVQSSSACSRTLAVDDVLIRPTESIASRTVYDAYDRPRFNLDDIGWATMVVYDQRGRPTRVISETVHGRDVATEQTYVGNKRRRTNEELAGGIHAAVGPQAMMIQDMLNGVMPSLVRQPLSLPGVQGAGLKGSVFDVKASPDNIQSVTPIDALIPDTTGKANE